MKNKKIYTTKEASELLNADITTISNWIDEGKLKAYRTPGGHRRVQQKALLSFVKKYEMPIFDRQTTTTNFLIVDDEPKIQKTVKKILSKKYPEARIFKSDNGFKSGKYLARGDIDCVILDIRMPGMDGFEVMEQIKTDPDLGSPAVIVITGYSEEGLKEEVKDKGAQKLLYKPFDIKELRNAVAEVLNE